MATSIGGAGKADAQAKSLTPVLIMPGFMSSALDIKKSPHKSWEGSRLWLDIASLGFQSLQIGGKLVKNEKRLSTRVLSGDNVDDSAEEIQMHREYAKQMECKSKWLWHLRLQGDMINEKEGVEVRPVPGTAGVDYLTEGALTESMSWVFGPVLKVLKAEGYIEGINLDAAPYDWRIPPSVLQSRDRYFSNTMDKIEHLYKKSNNKPVVLLCHSLGCKAGHYLLNFVMHQLGQSEGEAWIEKHLHSYVPVGAPHLGAPKLLRAVIDGDKMGLEAFLADDESLIFGRSLGSLPWMLPYEPIDGVQSTMKPPQSSPVMPLAILRNESTVKINLPAQTVQLSAFLHGRKTIPPKKVRLSVKVGNDVVVKTEYANVIEGDRGKCAVFGDQTWLIATPPTIEHTLELYPHIQLRLEEPGAGSAPKKRRGIFDCDILWIFRCLCCLVKWTLCCPFAVVYEFGCCVVWGAKRGADETAALLGQSRVIGETGRVYWKERMLAYAKKIKDDQGEIGVPCEIPTKIRSTETSQRGFFLLLKKPAPEKFLIKVKWEPPSGSQSSNSKIVCHHSHKHGIKEAKGYDNRKKNISYESINSNQLIQLEGLTKFLHLIKESYSNDPLGPRSLSAWMPPPIKKVTAIYGVNLPTEVGCAYRRSPSVGISMSRERHTLDQLFMLDKEARLTKDSSNTHVIKNGLISETNKTPQKVKRVGHANETHWKSGDGTVPYQSLQHCRAWEGSCDVTVHEIDSAEHRGILGDARFHKILLELLGCRQVP